MLPGPSDLPVLTAGVEMSELEVTKMLKQLQGRIGTGWCQLTHESVMWPIHGHYECAVCGRQYPAFEEEHERLELFSHATTPVRSRL